MRRTCPAAGLTEGAAGACPQVSARPPAHVGSPHWSQEGCRGSSPLLQGDKNGLPAEPAGGKREREGREGALAKKAWGKVGVRKENLVVGRTLKVESSDLESQ